MYLITKIRFDRKNLQSKDINGWQKLDLDEYIDNRNIQLKAAYTESSLLLRF